MSIFRNISIGIAICYISLIGGDLCSQVIPEEQDSQEYITVAFEKVSSLSKMENYSSAKKTLDTIINFTSGSSFKRSLAKAYYERARMKLSSFHSRDQATIDLLEALNLYQSYEDTLGMANCYMQMGLVNYGIENYTAALTNFNKVLDFNLKDTLAKATVNYLSAISHSELGDFEQAESLFEQATSAFKLLKSPLVISVETFLAKMYINKKEPEQAIDLLTGLLDGEKEKLGTDFLNPINAFLSSAYIDIGDYDNAIKFGKRAFDLKLNRAIFAVYIREASESLMEAYHRKNMHDSAFYYIQVLYSFKDSMTDVNSLHRIAELNGQHEFEQKLLKRKAEQDLKDAITAKKEERQKFARNIMIIALIATLLVAAIIYTQRMKLANEKQKSDKLLLNILPEDIADELKQKGRSDARQYDEVCIIFTDFSDFTPTSERLTASDLVKEINYYFEAFDKICKKFEIEKIKTIGDSYMAVGGLSKLPSNAIKNTVLAGLEMQEFVANRKDSPKEKIGFDMRIGIHKGPVVAGIVGLTKFQYDIWGDTVNTASRMESCGEIGKVNVSKSVYEVLNDDPEFVFESRGNISVKGKGEIEMYFVATAKT